MFKRFVILGLAFWIAGAIATIVTGEDKWFIAALLAGGVCAIAAVVTHNPTN